MMKNIYIFVFTWGVLALLGSSFVTARWIPSDTQITMIESVEKSMLSRQDKRTREKSDLVHERIDRLESLRGDEDIVKWFLIYSKAIVQKMDDVLPLDDIDLDEYNEDLNAELLPLRTIDILTVDDTEPGFLRVRAAPNTTAQILGKLSPGESKQILGKNNDNRYKISYDGLAGRVAGWYVNVSHRDLYTEIPDPIAVPVPVNKDLITIQDDQSLVVMESETKSSDDAYTSYEINDFVDFRYPKVHDRSKDEGVPAACMKYYDTIDAIAREKDFPTALVIATWYREFDCRLENPANTRGPFQVITTYKEPGPISVAELGRQVREFIDFSRGKYEYYTKLWKFDEIPVKLSHSSVDLVSIQKHSILYNGMYAGVTPANSSYANQNFWTGDTNNRDGIVTMFLKVERARR